MLKGANALIFGRGGGGGVINRVSKTADPVRAGLGLDAGIDSFGAWQLSADVNQPLGTGVAARVNATYEELGNARDFYEGRFFGVSPTVRADLGERTRISAFYTYDDDSRVTDRGNPSLNGAPLRGYDRTFFGDPDFNRATTRAHVARLRFDHDFSDSLSFNLTGQFADYALFYANVVPASATATTATLNGYTSGTDRAEPHRSGQPRVAGRDRCRRAHSPRRVRGWPAGYRRGAQFRDFRGRRKQRHRGARPQAGGAIGDTGSGPAREHLAARFRVRLCAGPDRGRPAPAHRGAALRRILARQHESRRRDSRCRAPTASGARARGWSFKPAEAVSLYASYATSFLPQSGDQFSVLDPTTASLAPEKFENLELGAKWSITPGLFATAALFRLDRSNTRAADPANPALTVLTGASRVEGFEASLVGRIRPNWQASLGYTYLDGEIRSTTTAAPAGRRQQQLPRHQASVWSRYDISSRFGLGLGAIYQARQFASISNAVVLPAWVRVDAAAYFDLSDRVALQVNAENLFDRRYYSSAHGDNNIQPGEPLNVRVGVRFKL